MLPHLLRRAARSVCHVALIALGVTLTASFVRVLPWLASDQVPHALIFAFLRVLTFSAVEVALLIAAPLGCALEAVRWVDDGTARALRTVGVGPAIVASHAAAVAVIVGVMSLSASTLVGTYATQPGRLSNTLVQGAGAHVCSTQRAAVVPLVNVTWVCAGGRPILVGSIDRGGSVVGAWNASQARFSSDLASVRLQDVHFVLDRPRLAVSAKVVSVAGIVPWIEPSGADALVRGVSGALVTLFASFAAAWSILWWRTPSRAIAIAAAIAGALPFFAGWSGLAGLPSVVSLGLIAAAAFVLPPAVVAASSRARLLGTLAGGTNP